MVAHSGVIVSVLLVIVTIIWCDNVTTHCFAAGLGTPLGVPYPSWKQDINVDPDPLEFSSMKCLQNE